MTWKVIIMGATLAVVGEFFGATEAAAATATTFGVVDTAAVGAAGLGTGLSVATGAGLDLAATGVGEGLTAGVGEGAALAAPTVGEGLGLSPTLAAQGFSAGLGSLGAGAAGGAAAGSLLGGSSGGAATTPAATGAGTGLVNTLKNAAIGSVASTAVGSLLAPKPKLPPLKPEVTIPDPLAQQAAQKRSLTEQVARRGRASTILTSPGGGKLGN
jgi:hypothetical protein